jgi:hypothetical protein
MVTAPGEAGRQERELELLVLDAKLDTPLGVRDAEDRARDPHRGPRRRPQVGVEHS